MPESKPSNERAALKEIKAAPFRNVTNDEVISIQLLSVIIIGISIRLRFIDMWSAPGEALLMGLCWIGAYITVWAVFASMLGKFPDTGKITKALRWMCRVCGVPPVLILVIAYFYGFPFPLIFAILLLASVLAVFILLMIAAFGMIRIKSTVLNLKLLGNTILYSSALGFIVAVAIRQISQSIRVIDGFWIETLYFLNIVLPLLPFGILFVILIGIRNKINSYKTEDE